MIIFFTLFLNHKVKRALLTLYACAMITMITELLTFNTVCIGYHWLTSFM